ncbi:MAG: alternative ribosome rescue aminoacyl-tRNA hydrolase ArfB [Actinomycetota bacterium]
MSVNEPLRVNGRVSIPPDELGWRFTRSSGPGGQNVNKVATRVELSYDIGSTRALGPTLKRRALERLEGRLSDGVLTVTASDERSQARNRELARERLADAIRAAIAPPPAPRRPTKPSRAATKRRLDSKRKHSEKKRLRRSIEE